MLKSGILNPATCSLLARVRHTNLLVIADRGFPYWPDVETVDLSLVDDIPRVEEVLRAIVPIFVVGRAWMANEFQQHNSDAVVGRYRHLLPALEFEPHALLKQRVPGAIGLIRTGDTIQYANVILESA